MRINELSAWCNRLQDKLRMRMTWREVAFSYVLMSIALLVTGIFPMATWKAVLVDVLALALCVVLWRYRYEADKKAH